jgi:hypothetical protein
MLASLEQFCHLYPPVRIQYSRETLFLVVARTSVGRKHARDLSENADRVYRVDIRNNVAIRVLIFEKESAEVRLTTLHHFLDGSDNGRITNDNGLVETRKEGTSSNRESKNLWIYFGNRLFRY